MDSIHVLKALVDEKKDWLPHIGESAEAKWTVRAIDGCINRVRRLAEEERNRRKLSWLQVSRWSAGDLLRAITNALACLSRADRGKAIRILEEAKAKALRERVNGPTIRVGIRNR